MTRQLCSFLLAAETFTLLVLCTPAPVSGPSTEEGNPQIVAVVVDNSKPVSGAMVTAYIVPTNNDTLQTPSGATVAAAGQTDAGGRCAFDSLPIGTYSIEATDPKTKKRAFSSGITIGDTGSRHLTDTLQLAQPGAITGVVSRGGVPGVVASQNTNLRDAAIMVIIQEIEVTPKLTPQNGSYSFSSLPPGTYTILYYATDGFFSKKMTVKVTAGDTTVVDMVVLLSVPRLLPPKGFTLSYIPSDSTVTLSWQKLDFDSLRWYEVERQDITGTIDKVFRTTDTVVVDTVTDIPTGTTLIYVVHSVDWNLRESVDNAGPLEVVVE